MDGPFIYGIEDEIDGMALKTADIPREKRGGQFLTEETIIGVE